jgi:Tfp pilus assembly PilM family ATPase
VELEAMEVIKGNFNDYEYDYTLMSIGKQKYVLFFAYPREKLEFYVDTLGRVGFSPLVMTHDSLALLEIYDYIQGFSKEGVFIINIGAQFTNLAVGSKGDFSFIRDVDFGFKKVVSVLSTRKNVSLKEAENSIRENSGSEEIKDIFKTAVGELIEEISTVFNFFQSRTGSKISGFALTGGGSENKIFIPLIEEALKVKGQAWNPLKHFDDGNNIPLDIKDKGEIFAVALGLLRQKIL